MGKRISLASLDRAADRERPSQGRDGFLQAGYYVEHAIETVDTKDFADSLDRAT